MNALPRGSRLAWTIAFLFGSASPNLAAERVDFIVPAAPDPLINLTAQESAAQFQRLFGVTTTIGPDRPADSKHFVILKDRGLGEEGGPGSPDYSIRSVQGGLEIVGANPAAVLWGAYELGHHFGMRYLLRFDIGPQAIQPLKLDGIRLEGKAHLIDRAWIGFDGGPLGTLSWSLVEHQTLISQLAKLKFNRFIIRLGADQPFVALEVGGVRKSTAELFGGATFPIDGDTPGRTIFKGAKALTNPDIAGGTPDQRIASGVQFVTKLIALARARGMTPVLSINPFEFSKEFASAASLKPVPGSPLLLEPASAKALQEQALIDLAAAQIDAYFKTYPNVEIELRYPDRSRTGYPQDYIRGEQPVVDFFAALLEKCAADGRTFSIAGFYPPADQLIGKTAAKLVLIRRESNRSARHMADGLARTLPESTGKLRRSYTIRLAEHSPGALSQAALESQQRQLRLLELHHYVGFAISAPLLGQLDSSVYFLSRAAFDRKITARQTHNELFTAMCGNLAAADRLWLTSAALEKAAGLIDQNRTEFAVPAVDMLSKLPTAEKLPAWWNDLNTEYTNSDNELYRANGGADERARRLLFYYAKRGEYDLELLAGLQAAHDARAAQKAGKKEEAAKQFETAIEQVHNAIDSLSDVAADPSDRALVAVLAAYAYRPLLAEQEQLER